MSVFIQNLTEEQIKARHERNNELAKLRQRKYYEKNKEKILLKKKETAKDLRETYKEIIKNQKDEELEIIIHEPLKPANTTKKSNKTVLDEETTINKLEMLDSFNSESTRNTYITGTKNLFRITGCKDLLKCLKSYNKIINNVKNSDTLQGEEYSINSKKSVMQAIVFLIDNLDIPITKTIKQKYNDYFDSLKILSHEHAKKKQDIEILPFAEYLKQAKTLFGEESKEYILASIYREAPLRDNLGHLKIFNTPPPEENYKGNYLLLPSKITKNKMNLIVNDYKTSNKYGELVFILTPGLTKKITKYIIDNKLKIDEFLFGQSKKLSNFVSLMNKSMGLSNAINLFREMFDAENNDGTVEARVETARKMAHTFKSEVYYKRATKKA